MGSLRQSAAFKKCFYSNLCDDFLEFALRKIPFVTLYNHKAAIVRKMQLKYIFKKGYLFK